MFYCEPCAKERNWPESGFRSAGACEICDRTELCYSVKASLLPIPGLQAEPDEHQDALKRIRNWAEGLEPEGDSCDHCGN